MKFRSYMLCTVIGCVMISSGFLLERLKVSINFILEKSINEPNYVNWSDAERSVFIHSKKRDLPYDYFHSHLDFDFLFLLSPSQLKQAKWVVTIFGLVFFAFLNALALMVFYPVNEGLKWILFLYSIILFLSCFFYFVGYLPGLADGSYQVTRKILNAGQSGIPAVLVYFVKKFTR
jgi:hypothetical protein